MSITRKMLKGMGLTEDQQISTHAPARGATEPLFVLVLRPIYFYSRPCERGDSNSAQNRHWFWLQIAKNAHSL